MKTGINSSRVQKNNRNLILKFLLEKKICSRVQLAKESNLEKATITNIVNEFFSLGIIENAGTIKTANGRSVTGIKLVLDNFIVLSLSISRICFSLYVYSINGTLLYKYSVPISTKFNEKRLESIVIYNIDEVLLKFSSYNVMGLCISLPGPYIRKKNSSIDIVEGFESLTNLNIEQLLKQKYNFYICSMHDVKVCAFGEWKNFIKTKNKIYNSLLYIGSVSSGVGAGNVINGKILNGTIGVAGEIGHMGINFNGEKKGDHPNRGSFECYASINALLDYVKDEIWRFPDSVLNDSSSTKDIFDAYYAKDELAILAFTKLANMLGYGISNMIYILNPEICVIGSAYPHDEYFINKVKETVKNLCYSYLYESIEIISSDMEYPQLIGGYYLLIDHLIEKNIFLEIIKKQNKQQKRG